MLPRSSKASVVRALRSSVRQATHTTPRTPLTRTGVSIQPVRASSNSFNPNSAVRTFHFSASANKGLYPDSSEPAAPEPASSFDTTRVTEAANIPIDYYHKVADAYLGELVHKLEEMQEERDDVDSDYSAGVLSISFPPAGTYVINKQPPNKQIWLSSPISGPKRYDYVVSGEGMHEKEGCGEHEWVYLRDGSTLDDLLKEELGIDMDIVGSSSIQ